ncbi:hypothetical protein FHL15_003148 [Xylaria flabelliformis]|uniref:Extracellular membrane protein CFEM domain-containing protein n=1 Tax=Xylaria flabelliformis TaxID=2512241 RepID=A0A553I730_9PEZI|nr:hypothetical protein FHL15_003148 [Xylaria flabelliformis]
MTLLIIDMLGLYMGVFALAGTSNASLRRWTYLDCEADNCYRAFINEQYANLAPSFCLTFLASPTTDAAVIPTPFENCAGDINAVSSACSCVTYTHTHTKTKTTSTPEATSTSSTPVITPTQPSCSSSTPLTTPSQVVSLTEVLSTTKVPSKTELSSDTQLLSTSCLGSSSSLSSAASSADSTYPTGKGGSGGYWGLSTVYSITTYTVTPCAPTGTDCLATSLAYITTTAIPVIVTVYPAHPSPYPVWTPGGALNTSNTLTTSRGAAGPTAIAPLSEGYHTVPTAAASQARFNEVAIAAGGAIAIAFL